MPTGATTILFDRGARDDKARAGATRPFSLADLMFALRFAALARFAATLQNGRFYWEKVVAGAGFEPTTFRL